MTSLTFTIWEANSMHITDGRNRTVSRRTVLRSVTVVGAAATVGTITSAPPAHATLENHAISAINTTDEGIHYGWVNWDRSTTNERPINVDDPFSQYFRSSENEHFACIGRMNLAQQPDGSMWMFILNFDSNCDRVGHGLYATMRPAGQLWNDSILIGERFSSAPVPAANVDGRIQLFTLDPDRHIWTTSQSAINGQFSRTWFDLGPNPYGNLGLESLVAVPAGDTIWLVGHDDDRQQFVGVPFRDGELGVWTPLNGVYPSQKPAVVRRSTGTLQLTMRGIGGTVYTQLLGADGSQSSPREIPGVSASGSVAAAIVGNDRVMHIAARGHDQTLHATTEARPGVFRPWTRIDGGIRVINDPAITAWSDTRTIVAFHDQDDETHRRSVDSAT